MLGTEGVVRVRVARSTPTTPWDEVEDPSHHAQEDEAVERADETAAAIRLGELLARLRKGANLTQRELGRRSSLSWTFIQLLEKGVRPETGRPVTPSPQSLQKIAAGLAVDPLDRIEKNPEKAAQFFKQMMEARGWSTDEEPPTQPAAPSIEELRSRLAALVGADDGEDLANLATAWPQLPPDARRFLMTTIHYVLAREGQHVK